MERLKEAWHNAFYRVTMCYIALLVTIIFGIQVHQVFDSNCESGRSFIPRPGPMVGVLYNEN